MTVPAAARLAAEPTLPVLGKPSVAGSAAYAIKAADDGEVLMLVALRPAVFALLAAGVSAGAVPAMAEDALAIPPELRPAGAAQAMPASSDAPSAKAKRPAKPKPKTAAVPPAAKPATKGASASPAAPVSSSFAAQPTVRAPKATSDDDPLSFGMKWNANNQPNHGSDSTDGLVNEYNKTLNDQTLGSGGAVGFKYKF